MRKEYRNAIIGGVGAAVVSAIISFIIRGQISWTFTIISSIVNPFAYLLGLKMSASKRDGESMASVVERVLEE